MCYKKLEPSLLVLNEVKTDYISIVEGMHLQWFASAEDEGRTEDASDYKIRKAREEGRVVKSQELVAAVGLLLPMVTLVALAPSMLSTFREMLTFFLRSSFELDIVTDGGVIAQAFFKYFISLSAPLLFVAFIAAIFSNLLQTGFLFTLKPITPKFSKVIPKFGDFFKKTLFSMEAFYNLAKSMGKILVVAFIAYSNIMREIRTFANLFISPFWHSVELIAGLSVRIVIEAAIFMLALAIPDYLFQRKQFMDSLKMTKQEVKEEHKMQEGDPMVKNRLRQKMRDLLSRNMAANVPKADVVITNPTHFAVAIEWKRDTMSAPMVSAKGQDEVAQRIKQIAREASVPIVENKPLARALYAEVEIGDMIPEMYYNALATVLAHVYKANGRAESISSSGKAV